METFEKVYIKSEADLPNYGELHYTHWERSNTIEIVKLVKDSRYTPQSKEFWLKEVDWYLRPLELSDITKDSTISNSEVKESQTTESGKTYNKVPFELSVETWDKLTPAERLKFKGLIVKEPALTDEEIEIEIEIFDTLAILSVDKDGHITGKNEVARWLRSRLQPAQSLTDEQIEKWAKSVSMAEVEDEGGKIIEIETPLAEYYFEGAKAYRDGQIAEWVKQQELNNK